MLTVCLAAALQNVKASQSEAKRGSLDAAADAESKLPMSGIRGGACL